MIVTRKLRRCRDRRRARELDADREEHLPDRHVGGERRVGGPAGRERAAGREERRRHHQAADRQHPVRQRVQPRERHVRRPDHQRQHVVRQPGEDRDDEQEDHQRRVDAEQPVVGVRVHELHPGRRQLGAHDHRQQAAEQHEEERGDDVLDADHLVVGVDAEVVLPRVRAVPGMVLRARRAARHVIDPVVEGADPDEEEQRREQQRGQQDRVLGLGRHAAVEAREAVQGADQQHHRGRQQRADHEEKEPARQTRCSQPRGHPPFTSIRYWTSASTCSWDRVSP